MKKVFFTKAIFIFSVCFSIISPVDTISQTNPETQTKNEKRVKFLIKKGNSEFRFGDYIGALPLYLELLQYDSTNFLYNYRAAMCYLKSNVETQKSVKYFEAANKYKVINDGVTFDFHYYKGQAYHITNRFDEAIGSFTIAKTFPNSIDSLADKEIKQCEFAKELMKVKTDARVFKLGTTVNSIYPDHSPLMLPDQSALIFTSARKGSTGGAITPDEGDFFEDIYISKKLPQIDFVNQTKVTKVSELPVFSAAENASILNTRRNDACLAISPDGSVLYLYRKNKIWRSHITNGKFDRPKKTRFSVLKKMDLEPSIYFTSDGKEIYFVSDRLGGYGGKDIYKSVLQADDTWGKPQNLGETINSELNEESPFFDTEEQTLYFSSQGHNSIGGFDVFKSKLQKDKWGEPANLGFPINSGTNDVFYTYDKKQNAGYFTTMRKEGVGNYDIFMIKKLQPITVSLAATYSDSLKPKNLKITIMNLADPNSLKTLSVNPRITVNYESNKEYVMLVPRYNADSILDTLYFRTPETVDNYNSVQEIVYAPMKNNRGLLIGYKTTIYNAFFDIEKEIQKSGVRNQKALMRAFPMCKEIIPALSYYKNENLTKEEEYSKFLRYIKPDRKNFKIYTQTNYVDTSDFDVIYKKQDSLAALSDMQSIEARPVGYTKTTHAPDVKNESKAKEEEYFVSEDLVEFKPVHFDLSKSDFLSKYDDELNEVAGFMKNNKDAFLELRGYTDTLGTVEFNKVLSLDRAIMVKKTIVKKGVAPERIKAEGRGEELAPTIIQGGKKIEPEKNNRRVIFIITDPTGELYKKKK